MPDIDIKNIWSYANNIIRTSRQLVNEGLHSLDLSSSEGNILQHLFTKEHEVRQEDIVEELDISKPAVSRAIKSLEVKGFITRNRDGDDRRAIRIILADKAKKIRPEVESVYNQVYAIAARGVSEQEKVYFIDLFARVSDNFYRASSEMKNSRRNML
ncbi:MAG: MarR family winged helix-turn-helix transcriptional regulator [Bacillota bacterium]